MGNKIPDELLLALAAKNSGGGGGGTTNYNELNNKPQIAGTTLQGDKSLSDLGIAAASDLEQVAGSIPDELADLTEDSGHRTVSDIEKAAWNGKQSNLAAEKDVANNVAFSGDIIDGQGNTLSVLAEALTKTASGNPVVIDDCAGGKARSLKTTIEAIQDLHGYDKPWAGGAWKNKYSVLVSDDTFYTNNNASYSGSDGILTISTSVSGADNTGIYDYQSQLSADISAMTFPCTISFSARSANNATLRYKTTSDSLYANLNSEWQRLSFTLDSAPSSSLVFYFKNSVANTSMQIKDMQIESGNTATSFAPYSNICPISGRTEARVDDVGKNLLKYPYRASGASDSGITYTHNSDGTISLSGTSTSAYSEDILFQRSSSPLSLKQGSYILSGGLDNNVRVTVGHTNPSTGSWEVLATSQGSDAPFTLATDDNAIGVTVSVNTNNYNANGKVIKPMIRDASITDATYVPYAHSSATIQLGQTVYGADINWDTGVMTVTDAIVDLGTLDWSYDSSLLRFDSYVTGIKEYSAVRTNPFICSIYQTISDGRALANVPDSSIYNGAQENIHVKDLRYNDAATFKTALSGQTLVYPLATPTTLQLTPTQLQMLKGYNRVTIDNGTITLDYVAKAISGNDEEIAPLVGDKATKSYSVNDFIERADGLYRVTAPIASGASFTANNTVKMSIGEALTYLYNK